MKWDVDSVVMGEASQQEGEQYAVAMSYETIIWEQEGGMLAV